MRIVHVIDYFHTDVGYQEFFLAREQARRGHNVRVVSSNRRQHTVSVAGPDELAGALELTEAGVEVERLASWQFGHDRAWLRGLADAITEHRPDVAHVHGPFCPTTVRAVWVLRRLGVPVLVDNHIQEAIAPGSTTPSGRSVYAAYRIVAGPMLRRRVGAWVANGPLEGDFLRRRLGLTAKAVELFPLAFDPEVFFFDELARQRIRSLEGWSDDETVVAVTGKLHKGKGVDLVAKAVEFEAGGRRVRLILAGSVDPSYLREVRDAVPTLDREALLEHRGMLPRRSLADLYLAADVVVFAKLPSISIYEAAGTGVRVLVGRDQFADWLHGRLPAIESVELGELSKHLTPVQGRAERADEAATTLGWPAISASFVDRYEQLCSDQ